MLLTWRHRPTTATGGRLASSYDVVATSRTAPRVTGRVVGDPTSATLSGSRPDALYSFTVTPRNSAGAGQAVARATMSRTLAQVTGSSGPGAHAPAQARSAR